MAVARVGGLGLLHSRCAAEANRWTGAQGAAKLHKSRGDRDILMRAGAARATLLHPLFELPRAVGAGVLGKDTLLRAISDRPQVGIVELGDVAHDVFRRAREKD